MCENCCVDHRLSDSVVSQSENLIRIGQNLHRQVIESETNTPGLNQKVLFDAGLLILLGIQLRISVKPIEMVDQYDTGITYDTKAPFNFQELSKMEIKVQSPKRSIYPN